MLGGVLGRRARTPRRASSTTTTSPWSRQAGPAKSAVGMSGRISLDVLDRPRGPGPREVVISTAGESGPCSAWLSRSTATTNGSACVVGDDQDLGRAGEQVDADLAEQLPLGLGDVGVARARRAGRPCRSSRCRWPSRPPPGCRRAGRSRRRRPGASPRRSRPGSRRGSAACRRSPARRRPPWRSPRSCARTRPAGSARPARTRPAAATGMFRWPRCTPGCGLDLEVGAASPAGAGRRRGRRSCTVRMSSMACVGTPGDDLLDLLGGRARNDSGDQPSNFSEYSRTAASPRSRTSAMTSVTVSLTPARRASSASLAVLDLR